MMIKFLVDADVNQRSIRTVPAQQKDFDILFPEAGSYKEANDLAVLALARRDDRVLVTGDRQFAKFMLRPGDLGSGVILLRPPRKSQKRIAELISKFCQFLVQHSPENPYDFRDRIITVQESGVEIETVDDLQFFAWPDS